MIDRTDDKQNGLHIKQVQIKQMINREQMVHRTDDKQNKLYVELMVNRTDHTPREGMMD